nr:unnamed protein product [Digitaria exilis]
MVSTRGGTSSIQLNAAVTTLKDEAAASARDFALSLVNPLKRVRVAAKDGRVHEIDRVHENLQGICGDLKEFIMLLQDCQPIRQPLPTNIFVDGQMFGRHVEKERIINFLLHDCGHLRGQLGVLSTVGDIGSGKTTLVQHACDDVRVRSYFSVIMLCCTYTIKTNGGGVVLHSKHVIGDVGIGLNDPLQLFNGSFGNRRFLVVFENMDMNKKLMFEDSLLPILRWSKEGSKVIITTNNRRVASIGTVEPIILKALPFPEYWFFFKARAFAGPVRLAAEQPAEQGDNGLKHMSFEEGLLPVLRCSKEGSMVIITTNNRQVACIGTVEPIILKALPFPEYWFFFKAHAFAGRDLEENPRLVAFGKAIAKKLNGSFFGAKIIGVILRDNPIPNLWCKKPTMADAIISAIIGDVVSRAISLLVGRFSYKESTQDKLQRISQLIIRIHSVIEEAKGRQISNHGTLQWLSELIHSEYQSFYLLDSIRCGDKEAERCDDKVHLQVSNLSLFNPAKRVRVAPRCTMRGAYSWRDNLSVDEIDRVLQRLQVMSCDLTEFIMLLQNCQPISRPIATNIFRDGQMFGRHVDKERIINFLLHEDDQSTEELGVLPIVGGNEIGKTTLVQYACDDARVRNHFPVIMLYNFSCTYDVKKNEGTPSEPLEYVQNNSFSDKRCLMVFEDVNMQRKQILKELLQSLSRYKEGSKVIITTNSKRVANIGTVEPIILTALPCPEYWFFFKAHAFAGRDIQDNPRLISAGKEIARKLKGSFFGAKIVGGVLRDNPDPKFWCKILQSNIGGDYFQGSVAS